MKNRPLNGQKEEETYSTAEARDLIQSQIV